MDATLTLLTIVGMAVVTYLPRAMPLLWLSSRHLPPTITSWLRHVPVAVLSALLFPALLAQEGQAAGGFDELFLLATIPTCLVAWKTRSFVGAVLAGIGSVIVGRAFLGF